MTNAPETVTETITAAAIRYRPNDTVRDLMPEPPAEGCTVAGYDIFAIDGTQNLAVHYTPAQPVPGAPLVLSVHGSGGSFAKQPIWSLTRGLVESGIPVLAINTRQHDDGVNLDIFADSIRDIEAGYWVARSLGFDRIVLQGHSLGTVQMSFFAANLWRPEVKGVVLTGMPANLPWKSRAMLIGDEAAYGTFRAQALAALREGAYDRVLDAQMSWLGGRSTPVSAGHFATYRDAEFAAPRSIDWVARVPYPLLMVRDAHDPIINAFEAVEMEAAARRGFSGDVTAVTLDSAEGTNGHAFEGSRPALVKTVGDWIKAR